MDVSSLAYPLCLRTTTKAKSSTQSSNRNPRFLEVKRSNCRLNGSRSPGRTCAVEGAADLLPVDVSWQIAVGALAGVTPFVVAGIEFAKRIVAQKRCKVCGGSGLVLTNGLYGRCRGCGGFLPWQSWKRFFTG